MSLRAVASQIGRVRSKLRAPSGGSTGTTYYFSATGSNANDGLSPATPKQTIAAANALTLSSGDTVAFKGGDTFSDATLTPKSGVTYTSYGSGKATISPPSNTVQAILALNVDVVSINNLIVSGASSASGIRIEWDSGSATSVTVSGVETSGAFYHGLDIFGHGTFTKVGSVSVTNSVFHGASNHGMSGYFDATSACGPVTISGVNSYSNTQDGIYFGSWPNKNIDSLNVSTCNLYSNGFNGIIAYGLNGGTWQYLSAHDNGATTAGGVGIFPWFSSNITIQFCESYNNTAPNTQDGDGFDLEGCSNCVIQYCYSHGNKGSGFFMYEYSGSPGSDNNTIRWCVSENDASNTIYGSIMVWPANAAITNVKIYNNTVYNSNAGSACLSLASNAPTGFIANNIFVASGTANQKAGTGGAGTTTDTNVWYGGVGSGYGTNAITTDPKLVSPGTGGTMGVWTPANLTAYRLLTGSPALDAGANLASTYGVNIGTADFYGNTIGALPTNLGAYDGAGIVPVVNFRVTQAGDTRITQAADTRVTN